MAWKDVLAERKMIILATSSKDGRPNAITVLSLGFVDNKLVIANCLMDSTLNNIRSNPDVCVVGIGDKEYYRLKGTATIFTSVKFFDTAVKKSSPTPPVKAAIAIDVKEVFDLENKKVIE